MTQRPCRICSCSRVSPTTSERRNPQPRSKPTIAVPPAAQVRLRRGIHEFLRLAPREPVADFPSESLHPLNPPDSNRQFRR
jgi:hypothetical protein